MYNVIRLVLAGLVRNFLEEECIDSTHYFRAPDLTIDDPVELPKGKVIRVRFDYVDEETLDL